jgi:hypothetical protein
MGKRISVHGFRCDRIFRRIERVVADLLATGNVVTPVDVLIGMGLLRPGRHNDRRCLARMSDAVRHGFGDKPVSPRKSQYGTCSMIATGTSLPSTFG